MQIPIDIIKRAERAVNGDSNDEEHDALVALLEAIAALPRRDVMRDWKLARIRALAQSLGADQAAIDIAEICDKELP